MSEGISKVVLRKNSDGSTTKVFVKKIIKKARILKKAPDATSGKKISNVAKPLLRQDTKISPTHATNIGAPKAPKEQFRAKGGSQARKKIIIAKKKGGKKNSFTAVTSPYNKVRDYSSRGKKDRNYGNKYSHIANGDASEKKSYDEFAGVPKSIEIPPVISIKGLALKLNLKASQILKKLFSLGVMELTLNDSIDAESAQIVCGELGCELKVVSLLEETKVEETRGREEDYTKRSAIVAVMGHVDHGKTTLLDTIRATNVVAQESGNITQHIGAYNVEIPEGKMVFIDTPGHEAFSAMRARGAHITDIVILVVSGTESVKPQTIESIKKAKNASVSIIVAVNKMDLPSASMERVKQDIAKHGIMSKEWGGNIEFYPISALKKQGIKELLKEVVNKANELDLKGNAQVSAFAQVIESRMEKGKGHLVTLIVRNGTLRVGDPYLCGKHFGHVRALFDATGHRLTMAGPATAVEVMGISGAVFAGDVFQVMPTEKEAKKIADSRKNLDTQNRASNVKKVTLSNLFVTMEESLVKELKVIVKGDVFGSVEAIKESLVRLQNNEVRVNVISASVGVVTENDINFASASDAIILGFKVQPNSKAKKLAKVSDVTIRTYQVIYELIDNIIEVLEGMLSQVEEKTIVGKIRVKEIFKISGFGKVAGSEILEGKLMADGLVSVSRNGEHVCVKSVISSLRRHKDEVKEVATGFECGVQLKDYQDLQVDDVLECFYLKKVEKKFKMNESE